MSEPINKFTLLCDFAFPGNDGKLNIIGIFKIIKAATFPYSHLQMFIVNNVFVPNPGKHEKKISIIRKRDEQPIISDINVEVVFPNGKGGDFGSVVQLANVKFEEAGSYVVQIRVDSKLADSIILELEKV